MHGCQLGDEILVLIEYLLALLRYISVLAMKNVYKMKTQNYTYFMYCWSLSNKLITRAIYII